MANDRDRVDDRNSAPDDDLRTDMNEERVRGGGVDDDLRGIADDEDDEFEDADDLDEEEDREDSL